MTSKDVVVPWDGGMFTFKTRWEAIIFRWLIRRWTGWTRFDFLREEEKKQAVKHRAATPKKLRKREQDY